MTRQRFRRRDMQRTYEVSLELARDPTSSHYRDGGIRTGANTRCYFWLGAGRFAHPMPPRNSLGWACYAAGQDFARETRTVGGRSGCVQLRRARETGRLVGVYYGPESGMDTCDGAAPWSTVCEDHGHVVSHASKALALAHAAQPLGWCEACAARLG